MRNLEIIARLHAKQAQGWQHGWVAVDEIKCIAALTFSKIKQEW